MSKICREATNDFCPQSLMLYGTYKEDGAPNFALFTWFSYYWDYEEDALGFVASIGEPKLTLDRIRETRRFSANLVTEALLPLADRLGNIGGYDPRKAEIPLETERGRVLDVPVLTASPVNFELEVKEFFPRGDGAVMLCRIRNVLYDEALADETRSVAERAGAIKPVRTVNSEYFGWDGKPLGAWGEPQKLA